MNLDLSSLEDNDQAAELEAARNRIAALEQQAQEAADSTGKPLLLKTADIDEDPDQPRTEFDLTEMRASIRAKLAAGKPPIKQPISVKPNREKPGRFLLNDGARRFRSCVAEGVEEIPAWVDEDHDDYDQVIVNNQHDKLKPMELALFIKKKLDAKESKGTIAERLGYDNAVITHHLALIEAPDCVLDAYRSGKTKSARTLYELRNAYERWPEQVSEWVESVSEVTRPQIAALLKRLDAPTAPGSDGTGEPAGAAQANGQREPTGLGEGAAPPAPGAAATAADDGGAAGKPPAPAFGHDQKSGDDGTAAAGQGPAANDNSASGTGNNGTSNPDDAGAGSGEFGHDQKSDGAGKEDAQPYAAANGGTSSDGNDGSGAQGGAARKDGNELTSWPKGHAVSDPDRMSRPLLLVEFDGRAAAVLLNRRPTTPGLVHIRFEDGSGDQEVDAGLCKINLLTEGGEK